MSNLDRQQPASPHALSTQRQEQGIALMPMDTEDFLPSLGSWSKSFGRNVMVAATAGLIGLAIWPWRETVRAAGVVRPYDTHPELPRQINGHLEATRVK